jgi:hypothetical protein
MQYGTNNRALPQTAITNGNRRTLVARSHIRRWLTRRFGPAGLLAFLDSCRAYPGFSIQHLPIRLVHRRMGRAIHRPEDLGC